MQIVVAQLPHIPSLRDIIPVPRRSTRQHALHQRATPSDGLKASGSLRARRDPVYPLWARPLAVLLPTVVGVAVFGAGGSASSTVPTRDATQHSAGVCKGSLLRARATRPIPGAGSVGVTFTFKNVSPTRCTVEGYPQLQMRDASGRPLPTTTVHAGGTVVPVILGHAAAAIVFAAWPLPSSTCQGPRAAKVSVRLRDVRSPIAVTVGSVHQPFTPCQGKVGVSPLTAR